MYCALEYIEVPKFEDDSIPVLKQILVYHSNEGLQQENKRILFNPNCPIQILLEYLCGEVGINRNLDFELCDSSTGETINIKQLNMWSYATTVLKPKQSYVLIIFEKDSFGSYKVMEPLLNKQSKQYVDVLQRIKRQKGLTKRKPTAVKKARRVISASQISELSYEYLNSKR